MTAAVAEKAKPAGGQTKQNALLHRDLKEAQHHRRHLWARVPEGVDKDDVRHPAFWRHITRDVSRHDVVTVLAWDETWELELCVERVVAGGVEMSVRKHYAREPVAASRSEVIEGFYSAHRADLGGWGVFRSSDDQPMVVGHLHETSARAQFFREQPKRV